VIDFIFREAARAVKKCGSRDPYDLLDAIGVVRFVSCEYPRDGLKGFSTISNRVKYAVINGNLNESEQRIVAGHEGAHHILHAAEMLASPVQALRDFDLFNSPGRIEYQANLFLADFLFGDNDVLEYVSDENEDFFSISGRLCVPPPLLAFKLYSMMRRGFRVQSPLDLDSRFLSA
jgi:Zn-dependent peptidase ImmA (M78 family)